MQKIRLETMCRWPRLPLTWPDDEPRGTVIANSTIFGCGYTYTYPRTYNPELCGSQAVEP